MILGKFITIAELRTQIAGYMYGVTPIDNDQVCEVQCIILEPQVGNHQSMTLPENLTNHLLSFIPVKHNFPHTPYYCLSSL